MSETTDKGQKIEHRVCNVCLNVGHDYYKTVLKIEKQIHWEYRVNFRKYYELFSNIDKKKKADWMLAYVKNQDYVDTYHSDVLEKDIAGLLHFHDMKIEHLKEWDEHVIHIGVLKYGGHLSQMTQQDSKYNFSRIQYIEMIKHIYYLETKKLKK
jgi:hypothetical protein